MERKAINIPEIVSYEQYACTHATQCGNMIFVSGQASVDVQGEVLHEGDIVAQCDRAFQNMRAVLKAAGATMKDVVHYNIYVLSNDAWDKIAPVRKRYFDTDPMPACVGVAVKELYPPGILLEMDAIAMVG